MSTHYDVAVIGGGPGGYVTAIRSAQLGLKTVCIEKRDTLGGTCLNVGCIPSKALLNATHKFHDAHHTFEKLGIVAKDVTIDVAKMQDNKNSVVTDLTKGIDYLLKKNKVTRVLGTAHINADTSITVGKENITASNIIIATGSAPTHIPNMDIDETDVVTSTGALEFTSIPKHLVVIGGGVIGLEIGSIWSRLGANVTVVEYADTITPHMDKDVIKTFTTTLKKQGFTFKVKTKVTGVEKSKGGLTVHTEGRDTKKTDTIACDKVLVAVGRVPYTDGLGLENVGVKVSERGFIQVDTHFKTNIDGIYAIGDVIGGAMLAHKAEEEGVAVAEHLAGKTAHVNHANIPSVIYTHPEVASTGQTEQQVKETDIAYTVGQFPFMANSRGRAIGETEGFVKIIAEKNTDKILGVHIVGPEAGNMIHEAVIIIEYNGTAEDLFRCCHAHPTLNEALKEAALAVHERAVHS